MTTGVYASEGEAGEGGPKPADSADKFYSATGQRDVPFGKAREKIMEGSGGEGGIGFSKSGPEFVAPALTDSQIKAALVGNTFRKDQAVAICKVDDLAGHRLGEIIAFREGLHRVFFR